MLNVGDEKKNATQFFFIKMLQAKSERDTNKDHLIDPILPPLLSKTKIGLEKGSESYFTEVSQ